MTSNDKSTKATLSIYVKCMTCKQFTLLSFHWSINVKAQQKTQNSCFGGKADENPHSTIGANIETKEKCNCMSTINLKSESLYTNCVNWCTIFAKVNVTQLYILWTNLSRTHAQVFLINHVGSVCTWYACTIGIACAFPKHGTSIVNKKTAMQPARISKVYTYKVARTCSTQYLSTLR